jgi:hypothetical protein
VFNGNGFLNGLTSVILAIAGLGAVAAGGLLGGGFMKDNAEAKRMDVETRIMVEQHEMARPFQEQQLAAETAVRIAEYENRLEKSEALHQAELNSIEANRQAEVNRLALEESDYAASLAARQAYEAQRNNVWLEAEKHLFMAGTALLFFIGLSLVIIMSWAGYKALDYHLQRHFSQQPGHPVRQPALRPVLLRPISNGSASRRPHPAYVNGRNYPFASEERGIVGD